MRFNVSGLLSDEVGASRAFDINTAYQVSEHDSLPVAGRVELLRTDLGVFVRARLRLSEDELCSRCLRPLRDEVPIEFDELYRSMADPRTGAATDIEDDPDAFLIDEQQMLDLTEAVRQYRETALEMQPLCRPDCKGLCPTCGSDLNEGPCDCGAGAIDSRWAQLTSLRSGAGDGKDN